MFVDGTVENIGCNNNDRNLVYFCADLLIPVRVLFKPITDGAFGLKANDKPDNSFNFGISKWLIHL